MARRARQRIPATDDWPQLALLVDTPGQHRYEVIRPVVLFGHPLWRWMALSTAALDLGCPAGSPGSGASQGHTLPPGLLGHVVAAITRG